MEYTKGTWQTEKHAVTMGRTTVGYSVDIRTRVQQIASGASEEDARLIVAAANACISVNAENPLAVAKSVRAMYDALRALTLVCRDVSYTHKELTAARAIIARVEGR